MQYYVEIRAGVRRVGPPQLVPLEQVHQHTGFRSVVAYDQDTKDEIERRGDTKFLRGYPVYADVLLMDFDDYEPTEFLRWLKEKDYAHEVYHSGGRSVHVHIPIRPVFGHSVPRRMKQWVQANAPRADTSFYHPGGQYRLPGTFHPKTGMRKMMLEQVPGRMLELPDVAVRSYTYDDITASPEQFYAMLLQRVQTGDRRPHVWRCATVACEAGLDIEETYQWLHWWNERFCEPPHDDTVIRRQIESAYHRLAMK